MSNSENQKESLFTEQEKTTMGRYYYALRRIHERLVVEGYFLTGGKIWNIFKVGTCVGEAELEENNQV